MPPSSICSSFKEVQLLKARFPISVTFSGIVIFLILLQLKNAPLPILVTLFEIIMFSNVLHFANNDSPIVETQSPIVTTFNSVLL